MEGEKEILRPFLIGVMILLVFLLSWNIYNNKTKSTPYHDWQRVEKIEEGKNKTAVYLTNGTKIIFPKEMWDDMDGPVFFLYQQKKNK